MITAKHLMSLKACGHNGNFLLTVSMSCQEVLSVAMKFLSTPHVHVLTCSPDILVLCRFFFFKEKKEPAAADTIFDTVITKARAALKIAGVLPITVAHVDQKTEPAGRTRRFRVAELPHSYGRRGRRRSRMATRMDPASGPRRHHQQCRGSFGVRRVFTPLRRQGEDPTECFD